MRLRVWGARGSIPCADASIIKYGGETTCVDVLADDGTAIILDLGTGARLLGNWIVGTDDAPRTWHVLLTHAHWDHLMGFPFFSPIYAPGYALSFHGWGDAQQSVKSLFEHAMKPPFFPVDLNNVAADLHFEEDSPVGFDINAVHIRRFPLSHPNGGCGFSLEENGKRVCFFPDNELTLAHPGARSYDEVVGFCRGADVLIHDAEYYREEYEQQTRGFGHTVFEDAVKLGMDAEVSKLILWHHKPERTDDAIDAIVATSRRLVADAGASLDVEAAYRGMIVEL